MRKGIFLSATFFLAIIHSCKEDGQLTPDFNTSQLQLNQVVVSATTSTYPGDSVRTDRVSRSLFGKLNDNFFGLTSSEIYTQIYMPSSALNTGDILESDVDSVILYLAYDGSYGYSYEHEIKVFELEESLDSSEYYSTSSAAYDPTALGSTTFLANPADTVNDTFNVVRIPLDLELGKRIIREQEFADQDAWLSFFRGLRLAPGDADPSAGEGNIVYFDMLRDQTKLTVYYKKTDNTSGSFSFIVGGQRFAKFQQKQSGTELEADLNKEDGSRNYLMSMAGSYVKVKLDNLEALHKELGKVAVNKAELFIPFQDPAITEYIVPDRTVLIVKDKTNGGWTLPVDYDKNGLDFLGGSLDPVNKQYTFNLASTVHEMLNLGDYNRELYLSVSGNAVSASRIALNSGNAANTERKIYLLLTYTKYN